MALVESRKGEISEGVPCSVLVVGGAGWGDLSLDSSRGRHQVCPSDLVRADACENDALLVEDAVWQCQRRSHARQGKDAACPVVQLR